MHLKDEIAFEKKAEQFFRSHREVPTGRNFLAWTMRFQNNCGYKHRFDDTFKTAPGSKARLDSEFCPKCGKRKVWCECLTVRDIRDIVAYMENDSKALAEKYGDMLVMPMEGQCSKP